MSYDSDLKVMPCHLEKNAYLYVRQSTLRQVIENTESTRRQYDLKNRALSLGWQNEQIQVIDTDLSESGASKLRDGFKLLVAEVGMGRAGIVMGLEVSRLARNSSDWHRLLEICALTSTLILDEEGIYDPSHFNDRLLLGLKGTMSEAELFVIRQRLIGGMMSKARRGELKIRLPIGFDYDSCDSVVLSPDKRVRESVALFFATYHRLGSASAVVQKFNKEGIKFPKRMFSGPKKGEVVFGKLTDTRAYQILRNPRYAGAFAYGLRQQVHRGIDKKPLVRFVKKDMWKAFVKNAHKGYISWEEYEENQARLAENARCTEDTRRCPPREGPALLQGIAVCGICGRRMSVRYRKSRQKDLSPYYSCRGNGIMVCCQSISGQRIDDLVEELLLKKMTPSVLEIALSVNEGRDLVDGFIQSGGYIDTLLMDRGYIDGPTLTHYKKDCRINWVIPLKKSMDTYDDVMGLTRLKNTEWKLYRLEQDSSGFTKRKEEVTTFFNISSWESLSCPLHISIKRETNYESGETGYFVLAHSRKYKYPSEAFDLYKKRAKIEERHRQLKGFWDLTKFTSPSFSLVATQIIFKLVTYSLMQLYLVRADMAELAKKTISTITKKERAGECVVILYSGSNYGVFDLDEYSFILMKLKTDTKKKLTKKIKTWNKSPP